MESFGRYAIFVKRVASLGGDDFEKEYIAVPVDYLSNGIFIPASHYEIDPMAVAEVSADSEAQAIHRYREALLDSFL